nr:hypothetical protein B3E4.20 [imported] - Neurospora crassa [Neurospora crassa]
MSSPQLNVPEESPTSIPATAFSLMSIDMDLASSSTNGTGTGTPSDNVPSINLNYFPNNNHMAPSAISNGFHSMSASVGDITPSSKPLTGAPFIDLSPLPVPPSPTLLIPLRTPIHNNFIHDSCNPAVIRLPA